MTTFSTSSNAPTVSRLPVCVGSGFVALDLIYLGHNRTEPDFTFAGGSCGNVLTILAYLGWNSVPVIRLKDDGEAAQLIADLEKWQVNTRFVCQEEQGITPVVVQRICTSINGDPYHRFEWRSPSTGVMLPRYRPLPQRIAIEVSTKLPKPKVFYFDRPAPSALLLAAKARDLGATIFFEPSSIGEADLFAEAIGLADVVKYASNRLEPAQIAVTKHRPPLEIQTSGAKGLRFRRCLASKQTEWQSLPAISVDSVKDTAGAGDWCSAGIIHTLMKGGVSAFRRVDDYKLLRALRAGQHLAALNCSYEGARGAMYHVSAKEIRRLLLRSARSPF